jgi:phosphomethylpyrimidine synthase
MQLTQYESAVRVLITPAMEQAAVEEGVSVDFVRSEIAAGRAVLPFNPRHTGLRAAVAGRAFRTKVNANIGCSAGCSDVTQETRKLEVALKAGADFVMDLSVGSDVTRIRRKLLAACPVPLGTVPIYEALYRVEGRSVELTPELLIDVIRRQAEEGVDFMTLHAGLLRAHLPAALRRKLGIVSRGGAILGEWMTVHEKENPLFTAWDEVLTICRKFDVTVSLGDGLRPGCLADASDEAQFSELEVLGELVKRTRAAGVQVMVEGPGHVPLDQIAMNIERQQRVCDGAPFYVLGPLVTDIAAGYDHIASSIGGTWAAFHGACLLCYVTPAEHLGLPTEKDVHEGVVAHRIAAHAADAARGLTRERNRDDRMAEARAEMNWERQFELALDGDTARRRFAELQPDAASGKDHCSMCGKDFCAIRTTRRIHERNSAGG